MKIVTKTMITMKILIVKKITKTNYTKFREFFENGDKDLIESLKKECEIVLLNNR